MAFSIDRLKNYTQGQQSLILMGIDHYSGKLKNYVSEQVKSDDESVDKQIREKLTNEVFHGKEFNRRTYLRYQREFYEVMEVILDSAIPDGMNGNAIMDRFVEQRRIDLGDTNEYYAEGDSLLTVSRFSGNHWDTIRERFDLGTSFSIPTSWYVAHIYDETERFMKELISWVTFINKIRDSFMTTFYNAIYTALFGLSEYVPEAFSGKGALTSEQEKKALLEMAEKLESLTGKRPIFAGSVSALRQVQSTIGDSWISANAKDERANTGVVSHWEGYELLPIPQYLKRGTYDLALPTNKILLIGSNTRPIKFTYEGDTRVKSAEAMQDNMDMSLELQVQVKAGVGVAVDTMVAEWELA